jgi:hypothetical protein
MNYRWKPGRFRQRRDDANVKVVEAILSSSAFVVSIASEA